MFYRVLAAFVVSFIISKSAISSDHLQASDLILSTDDTPITVSLADDPPELSPAPPRPVVWLYTARHTEPSTRDQYWCAPCNHLADYLSTIDPATLPFEIRLRPPAGFPVPCFRWWDDNPAYDTPWSHSGWPPSDTDPDLSDMQELIRIWENTQRPEVVPSTRRAPAR